MHGLQQCCHEPVHLELPPLSALHLEDHGFIPVPGQCRRTSLAAKVRDEVLDSAD